MQKRTLISWLFFTSTLKTMRKYTHTNLTFVLTGFSEEDSYIVERIIIPVIGIV